jgi:hypothetical protein
MIIELFFMGSRGLLWVRSWEVKILWVRIMGVTLVQLITIFVIWNSLSIFILRVLSPSSSMARDVACFATTITNQLTLIESSCHVISARLDVSRADDDEDAAEARGHSRRELRTSCLRGVFSGPSCAGEDAHIRSLIKCFNLFDTCSAHQEICRGKVSLEIRYSKP